MGGFIVAKKLLKSKSKPIAQVQKAAVKAAPAGPTLAEIEQDKRRITGRRGRRATILTSYKGVDEDVTLGTKTLLG